MKIQYLFTFLFAVTLMAPSFSQTTVDASMTHDGLNRTYRLYIPESYNSNTPVPLLLNLHGYTSNNIQQEFYGDFRPIADTANFIIVHPNGTTDNSGNQFWSAFGLSSVDDTGFLAALIDEISAQYSIDPNCIYSTGMSNGGFMSYELACQLSGRIAAIASVTGSMIESRLDACNSTHPTPVMQIHGTADPTVPYIGIPAQTMMHIDTLVKRWAELNSCDMTPTITQVPNISLVDGCTAEHFVFDNGTAGSSVELYKVNGGAHTWPGAPVNIGVTNQDFDASIEIWRFFRRYKLNNLTTDIKEMESSAGLSIFPNPTSGNFTLKFDDSQKRMIIVTDQIGRIIMNRESFSNLESFAISCSGIYLLTIRNENSTTIKKLIVE